VAAAAGGAAFGLVVDVIATGVGLGFVAGQHYPVSIAATSLAGTALGAAGFGPSRGVSAGNPLPFAAATALLIGLAVVLSAIAARTTVRRDIA
jgi:hypothetical protein